jgi:membrane protease YdiL (CAAX protease family)
VPDDVAARLRGFGPLGILATIVILFAGTPMLAAPLALLWARLSRTPWDELGFVRPVRWVRTAALGVALGVAFKLVMKAVVMPLLGADPINRPYHYLAGNTSVLPWILFAVIYGAGFGEETVFRGFLFQRLGTLLGRGTAATVATVLLTTAWFALAHYPDQGRPGVEQALFTGLLFGTIYAVTRRIWLVVIAHAAFDVTAVALIYWNLEQGVAHLLFK